MTDTPKTHTDEQVERVAAAMWKAEAVDSGSPESVARGRTIETFLEQSEDARKKWLKFARAALSAMPAPVSVTEKTSETDDEAEVTRRLIKGERIFYSQDGDVAWLSGGDRAYVSDRVVWALRNNGALTRVSSEEGRVSCDEASDALRAISGGSHD